MANGIDIVIGAEVSGALQGLQKVEAATVKAGATINKLPAAVNTANQSLSKFVPGANSASTALINLGRVAQDAPFGIIGIANNLNPLLESFQRTAEEAGGFKNALAALGSSLIGGAGVGLALSLVTGAMSYFSMQSRKTKEDTERVNKAAEEAAQKQKEFESAVNAASSAVVNQSDRLTDLRSILISTGEQLSELSKQTINQAVTQYLFTQKRELLEQLIGEKIKGQLATGEKLLKNYKNFQLTGNESFGRDTEVKLENLNRLAEVLGVSFGKIFNQTFNKGGKSDLDKWSEQFAGASIQFKKPIFIEGRIFDFNAAQEGTDLLKKLEYEFGDRLKSMEKLVVSPKISLSLKALNDQKALKEAANLAESFNKQFENILTSGISSSFESLGDTIGEALTGNDFGKSILNVFSGVLSALGSALIQFGVIKSGLDKILGPAGIAISGTVAIGLGILAKAAGSAIKNFGGARAMGGPVSAGRSYLVGEREPELFVPSQNGTILNGNQIAAMSYSGGGSSGGGRQIIRGQNIILSYARTNRAQNRLGRG